MSDATVKSLHVVIDGMRLSGQRLGVGREIEYLLSHWAMNADAGDHFTVLVREPVDLSRAPPHHARRGWSCSTALPGYAWQSTVMVRAASRTKADVFFRPSYRLPPLHTRPSVVAIHSINQHSRHRRTAPYCRTHGTVYRTSAQAADRVSVPSRSTLEDIAREYGIDPAKVSVIPQGADEAFRPLADPALARAARLRWIGEDVPYVLWVGKLSPRRNIPVLLEGFALLKRRTQLAHKLLLFGPNHLDVSISELASKFGVVDDVVQTDGVVTDHRELVPVYAGAALYVNPSAYEGFSMRLVEALSCGLPCVVADSGALVEIIGDAGLVIDEVSPDSLASAMLQVLDDPVLTESLRHRALGRAIRFRWLECARRTLDVLREIAAGEGTLSPRSHGATNQHLAPLAKWEDAAE